MKLTEIAWVRNALVRNAGRQMRQNPVVMAVMAMGLLAMALLQAAGAQALSTTTVQGTVYLANGQAATGTLRVSWPSFTSANAQWVAAGSTTATIAQDGFVSLNLTPNVGATPAGLYYTATFYMSDGTTNTQYWVVPAAAQASLAQVQSQVMPAAQAVQAVSKAYVDQAISALSQSTLTASGGTLSGPLYLNGDPTQLLQAADKHYVDTAVSQVAPIGVSPASLGQIAYYTSTGTSIGGMNTIPLTAGGTGSAGAAGALQNLGGISSTATAQQTMAGPLNANVNGVIAVTVFGAKGDCTGSGSTASCTDNHAAIQAAIDAAYASSGSVYFPSNASSTNGQTVYYTSLPINPKGVSMYGPVGGNGHGSDYLAKLPTAVRGAPGQDVFNVVDPTATGYVTPQNTYSVRDLAIIVDDSTDVSSSFPSRRPGRQVMDATMSSGSGVVTSATAQFMPGDVGQAVTVAGAGSSGGTLSTAIGSWQSATQVTLTSAAGTTVSASTMYISVMGLASTQNIGNCAFAYDDKTAAGTGPTRLLFSEVIVNTVSNNNYNHTCGFFFQGNVAPYQARWEHMFVGSMFPFAFVPASAVAPSTSRWTGLADFNVWDHVWMNGTYSFLSYNGGYNAMRDIQITGLIGPNLLSSYGLETYTHDWHIDIPELEATVGCTSGLTGFRISGSNHLIERLEFAFCSALQAVQWDASSSTVKNLLLANAGNFNITGNLNAFDVPTSADFLSTVTYSNTGRGNTLSTGAVASPLGSIQPARKQMAAAGGSAFGPPDLSRPAYVFSRTHDFLNGNAATPFFNGEDLWLWPTEVAGYSGAPTLAQDSSSESGWNMLSTSSAEYYLTESNGTVWVIGKQFPAAKMRFYARAKIVTAGNWYMEIDADEAGTWTVLNGCTLALTTGYSTVSCDVDATGLTGDQMRIGIGGFGMPATNVNIAWIGVRPWTSDLPVSSIQVSNGTPLVANHGTGTSVQHSDGTGTSGACFFAADGSCTATAGALQNGATATTQSSGDNSNKVATDAFVAANAPATGLTPYGTIYNAQTWPNLSAFTNNGIVTAPTVIAAGTGSCPAGTNSCIQFTSSYNADASSLDYNYYTLLPIWTLTADFVVGPITSTSYGLGFGLRSQNAEGVYTEALLQMQCATASTGTVNLVNVFNTTAVAINAGGTVLTLTAGDTVEFILSRNYDTFTGTVQDLTTGQLTNVTYQYTAASGATYLIPNIGKFAIYDDGGTQTLTKFTITSGLPKGADVAAVADSKGEMEVASYAGSWPILLQNYYRTDQLWGGSDGSADLVNEVAEIIALAPKIVVVMAPGNDVRDSILLATTEANVSSFVSSLQAAGITVYVTTYPQENSGTNFGPLNSWIASTFAGNYIDLGHSFVSGSVPATWLNADNVHPTALYHAWIAQTIATRLQHDSAKQQFPYYVTP